MSRKPKKNRLPKNRDLRSKEKTISGATDRRRRLGDIHRDYDGPAVLKPVTQNPYAAWAICGFLLLAVVLVFGQTVHHDFIDYDDDAYVYNNPRVVQGLSAQGIYWAFTSKHVTNWHPLTWLSHMLDFQLYGLVPGGHHLTNVLLHVVTAILLFFVLLRMTGDLWPSAFVAAVFAIHPLHVESVAWVAERKDVLSGLFFMLTLGAYVGYVHHPFSLARYLMVLAFFALGLMAKPMLVTLPFVLLLFDYWPLGRITPPTADNWSDSGNCRSRHFLVLMRLTLEKVPLLALAGASCAATLWAQRDAIAPNELMPFAVRVSNAAVSCVAYLSQLFYPAGLAVLYPHPVGLPMWKIAGAILVLVAISGSVVALRRRCPYLLVGWLWYMGMLVPVIGLIQVGSQAMADRYTYLTQIGLYIAIAWGVAQLCRALPYSRCVCGIASALVLAVLMGCAWRQTSYWYDSKVLWTHTLACTSQNFVAHNNLGNILVKRGQFQEAMEHYQQALQLNPDYPETYNNLGVIMDGTGRSQEAVDYFQKALRLNPDYADAHNNLGKTFLDVGRLQEAMEQSQQALRLKPDYPEAHNNLGSALANMGRPNIAIEHYKQAILLRPDYANAYKNMALVYAGIRQSSEAIDSARKAIELARSQGQTELARQIDDWLNSYRAGLSNIPSEPSP